jgi:hypothetical protein
MKKIIFTALPVLLALVFVFQSKVASAQTASCEKAEQTCYQVIVKGIVVKTVGGKAVIRL